MVLGVVGSIFAPELLGLMGASLRWSLTAPVIRVLLGGNIVIIMLFLVNAIFGRRRRHDRNVELFG